MEWNFGGPVRSARERMEKMRPILVVAILLALVGCQNFVGPFQPRSPSRVDDPRLSPAEQERRTRAELALPQPSPNVAPSLQSGDPNSFIQER
jgi:hypothetical protein